MFATVARFSKASRLPLNSKRAGKDFYKGYRHAYEPGGRRTGAPGEHVIRGKAKYRLLDEKVRIYIAPAIEEIRNSKLKPYVYKDNRFEYEPAPPVYGQSKMLSPERLLTMTRPEGKEDLTSLKRVNIKKIVDSQKLKKSK
ncbi:hypothetical protein M422DRAFT_210632 [Sphaerobolus stellatus SS14]|uniref:54S ribosomal protein L27, mitochondrial n=1 Tax=Sphaerobolus stellatus (strain SS14) TaxID=990650 RepID=A0A0C9U7E8_SPHS4|nr:hypothetical protein M422DRAFT_210632 [Sphaerobolus stellatus SS14]